MELHKLQVYPIPVAQLFGIEVMLRVTAGIEMVLILVGLGIGVLLNPELPAWCAFAVLPYGIFNLFFAVGLRDLLARILACEANSRNRFSSCWYHLRRIAAVIAQARPGLECRNRRLACPRDLGWLAVDCGGEPARHGEPIPSWAVILAWTAAAAIFGRWQFDAPYASMRMPRQRHGGPLERGGPLETFYRHYHVVVRRSISCLD